MATEKLEIGGNLIIRGNGAVHSITLSGVATGTLMYCVQGRMCFVSLTAFIVANTGGAQVIYNQMPKAKMFTLFTTADNSNAMYVQTNQTILYYDSNNKTSKVISFCYPVADDYVES